MRQRQNLRFRDAFQKRTRNYAPDDNMAPKSPHHDVMISLGMKRAEDTPSGDTVYMGSGKEIFNKTHAHMKNNGFSHYQNKENYYQHFEKDGHKVLLDMDTDGLVPKVKMTVIKPPKSKIY